MTIAIEHGEFIEACDHAGIDRAKSAEAWRELAGERRHRGLARTPLAALLVGMVLLSAANIWWARLLYDRAGASGLAVFGFAWTAVFVAVAELGRRSGRPQIAAAFGAIAVAYLPLGIGATLELAGFDLGGGWLDGRALLELIVFAAAVAVVYRYREPILTMLPATLAGVALVGEAILAPFGTGDPHMGAGLCALAVAAIVSAAVVGADRRRLRDWAFWPALAADVFTVAGTAVIVADRLPDRPLAGGIAFALAGIAIVTRGLVGGRLAQLATGTVTFWVGVLMATSDQGAFATAAVLTLAGASLIGGTVLLVRRRDLLERQRR
jgi:hypothetical protein